VGEVDRRRHQHLGLVAGVAEHQALVTRALLFRTLAVDTLVDVRRLLAQGHRDRTGRVVEALVRTVVADAPDHVTDDVLDLDPCAGLDLAADQHQSGGGEGLGGDTRLRVLGQIGIEDGVGHLVAHLVRMTLGHGFGGKQVTFAHGDEGSSAGFMKRPF
jgi:hypothetical protein